MYMIFCETDCIKPSTWYSKFLLWKTQIVFLISTMENPLNGILKSDNRKPLIWFSKKVTA